MAGPSGPPPYWLGRRAASLGDLRSESRSVASATDAVLALGLIDNVPRPSTGCGRQRVSAAILEITVSDRDRSEGLTQFAFYVLSRGRKLLILKWRDGRVVEGARLEIDFGGAC